MSASRRPARLTDRGERVVAALALTGLFLAPWVASALAYLFTGIPG